MDMEAFTKLYRRLSTINFHGTAGEPLPPLPALAQAMRDGANMLPHLYSVTYAQPLDEQLQQGAAQKFDPPTVEMLTAAVYQHRNGALNSQQLRRFLAAISNFYLSFIDKTKRKAAFVPVIGTIPPLAMFQHEGQFGPRTITSDNVNGMIGVPIGVVSLPATYANHPVIWAALAHETGGHDVIHADPILLPELTNNIAMAWAGMPPPRGISIADLTQLWAHWLNEATADVYGVLNMGPALAANFAAFFSAAFGPRRPDGRPALPMESGVMPGPEGILDPHPTAILRLHLAAGVIDALTGLSKDSRDTYIRMIEELAQTLATGSTVRIRGNIPTPDHRHPVNVQAPLADMQQAARSIGGFIATARLSALGGHSIQDIETWDDKDEARAMAVKNAVIAGQPIADIGDDAQLLAGVTLALLDRPDLYDAATRALNDGLDLSFKRDPIWGEPQPMAVYFPHNTPASTDKQRREALEPAPTG
jgi:hypothetical protein